MDVAQLIDDQELDAAVFVDESGEAAFVGGFVEFVGELGAGGVADAACLFAGDHAKADE